MDDLDYEIEDDYASREGGVEDSADVIAVLGRIAEVNYIGWCRGAHAWDVEIVLTSGEEVTLTLDEAELRSLAEQEKQVAEAWDGASAGLSDAEERAAERRQMGIT